MTRKFILLILFPYSESSNSFCDCTPFYFTEFPLLQKMKNKAFPEPQSFPLDNSKAVFPAAMKTSQNCFFTSILDGFSYLVTSKIATANKEERIWMSTED